MTTLQVRRVRFDFDGDVPFAWHRENPEFALSMNATGIIIVGFEKYIVNAVRQAMPLMSDSAIIEEADAFLRQEAQHARAHRMHLKSLFRSHPGLQNTLDQVVALYDDLYTSRDLPYHLAYIADLEATFTPTFKMMLDHEDDLFRPGDERVASLFLWHFVEEVEHRSSALEIYDDVVGRSWYRLFQLPSVVRHLSRVLHIVVDGFNRHVPLADRLVDARCLYPSWPLRRQLSAKMPSLVRGVDTTFPLANHCIPPVEQRRAYRRLAASQLPNHDPEDQPLPEFAATWAQRYERGDDVSHWYSSTATG